MRKVASSITIEHHKPKWRLYLIVSAAMLLSACAGQLKTLPTETNVKVPNTWSQAESKAAVDTTPVNNNWLNSFNDEELKGYMDIALRENPDLNTSAARLKTAIEQVRVTGANLWPNLSVSGDRSRIRQETGNITTTTNTVSASLDIIWELDIWGKLTQQKKSVALTALAEQEIYRAAELSLVANLARAWFNLITSKLQLDLANQRLNSFERTAALIDENYQRGLRSALDVYLSRTDVQLQRSELADTEYQYIEFLRAFKTILGQYPDDSLAFKATLPDLNGTVSTGLPADLINRRPDVIASQLSYQASIADAKVAHRNRFPSLSFTGSIGDSRERINHLFDNNNLLISLIAGVSQPLFNAGALKSQQQQAIYQAESAYATLVKTTLTAFEEVENALSREQQLKRQHEALKRAVEFAQGGLDLALDQYKSGIVNYNTVLEAQRRLFNSLQNEINLRNALLQNRITLHLALGGDFNQQETLTDISSDQVSKPETISDKP